MTTQNHSSGAPMLFLAGLAIGGIITALVTPRSGQDMRRAIKDRSDSMKEKARSKAEEVADKAEQTASDAKDKISRRNNTSPPL